MSPVVGEELKPRDRTGQPEGKARPGGWAIHYRHPRHQGPHLSCTLPAAAQKGADTVMVRRIIIFPGEGRAVTARGRFASETRTDTPEGWHHEECSLTRGP